jgi:hypothetical protein
VYPLLEEVLPWLLAFYVIDSIALGAAGETLFARCRREFGAEAGPLVAGLLPWAEVVSGCEVPVRLSAAALHWPQGRGFVPVAWEALGPIERIDRTIHAAGRSVRLPSAQDARRLAARLARLRDQPAERRDEELAAASAAASDVAEVRRLRERAGRHGPALAGLGAALLLGFFVLIPLGLGGRFAAIPDPAHVLLGLVPVYLAIVALSWRSLRSCGLSPAATLNVLSGAFFFPVAAAHMRACLGRRLYAGFDVLAVAAALLPPPAFRRFARERFHRLQHEAASLPMDHVRLAVAAWRRAVLGSGQTPDAVLSAPAATDPQAASYCPLCSTEYRPHFTACSDCRVALLPLASG